MRKRKLAEVRGVPEHRGDPEMWFRGERPEKCGTVWWTVHWGVLARVKRGGFSSWERNGGKRDGFFHVKVHTIRASDGGV